MNLIAEKLFGRHEDFLKYCKEAGKKFVDELDREDFIAYRSEYSVAREEIEQIKILLDFQEDSPQKNISDELTGDSLGKFFNVDDLAPYENILVVELDFNLRVQNCLRRNGYKTLAELLKSSRQEISGLKNFGQGSLDNLLSTLEKFFAPRQKKISVRVVRRAEEELDEFLRDAALNHDPQIDLTIAAFENFSEAVNVSKFFRALPAEIKNKRAKIFAHICAADTENFFSDLPEDLTLADLPKYLYKNFTKPNYIALKNFVKVLDFDARASAKKIFAEVFKSEREFEVVRRRAEGITLNEIGEEFGLTRERVRQIESKALGRFARHQADVEKIFYFLHALTDGNFLLTRDDLKIFVDAPDAELIWFFAVKMNLSTDAFHFDEKLNGFVFADESALDENELAESLPDLMTEKIFEETILNLVREKNFPVDLTRAALMKIYRRRGKIFHRGRLTLTGEYLYVLKERFPGGYKIADETFYSRFVRYLQEIFDETTPLTQRNVDAKIGAAAVLCDRGKYIHPDLVHVPPEIVARVKNFIDDSERTALFYKEIFEALKKFFVGTQITNRYMLQGVIKFFDLPYTLRKDYLTKETDTDMGKEFDSFVAARGEVSTQEIKENFISLADCNIEFLLKRCPEIIRAGDGIFIHATHLDLREEDFASIKKFLRQNCSTPVSSRVLFDLFCERFADFMTRNDIQRHSKLFGVLQYMFDDEFNFSRPYVSLTDIKDITNKKFLLSLLESAEEIEIDDVVGLCEENGIPYIAKSYLVESLRPEFVRVDEFALRRPESIGATDEIISAVAENVRASVERNGGWLSIQNFDDYEWLPQLETPWNIFLLESILSLAEDAPARLKIPSTAPKVFSTIFVSEEFAQDDYETFLIKILSAEHAREPFRSEKEIFKWLKEQDLCSKKLPKFLEGGRAFELLGE